ncbi:RNA polymerase sigma-70 factor [Chitinophaga sp.]|uniref:RNA polymerase sigma factor n=1 Tax=Chitinophaga sp. TaxID=1869181 RepID=UPI0031DE87ED
MPTVLLYDDTALFKKVAQGDETAFRTLFDRYWDTVHGVALALTKSATTAEEMAQDVFVKLWLKRDKLAAVANFEGYLFMVARNHIFNSFRKKIQLTSFTDHLLEYAASHMAAAGTPDERLLYNELETLVAQAVNQMPPQQRSVYCMSRQQGLSQEEIADALHISRHTVKSHMNKALHLIRNYLREHATIEMLLLFYFMAMNAR